MAFVVLNEIRFSRLQVRDLLELQQSKHRPHVLHASENFTRSPHCEQRNDSDATDISDKSHNLYCASHCLDPSFPERLLRDTPRVRHFRLSDPTAFCVGYGPENRRVLRLWRSPIREYMVDCLRELENSVVVFLGESKRADHGEELPSRVIQDDIYIQRLRNQIGHSDDLHGPEQRETWPPRWNSRSCSLEFSPRGVPMEVVMVTTSLPKCQSTGRLSL